MDEKPAISRPVNYETPVHFLLDRRRSKLVIFAASLPILHVCLFVLGFFGKWTQDGFWIFIFSAPFLYVMIAAFALSRINADPNLTGKKLAKFNITLCVTLALVTVGFLIFALINIRFVMI